MHMDIGQIFKDLMGGSTESIKEMMTGGIGEHLQAATGGALDTVGGLADTVGLGDELNTVVEHAETVVGLDIDGDGDAA